MRRNESRSTKNPASLTMLGNKVLIPLGSRKSPTAHLCNRALQVVVRSVANQSAMQRTLLPMTAQYSPRCSWFEPELKVRCIMLSPALVAVELQ